MNKSNKNSPKSYILKANSTFSLRLPKDVIE